MEIIILSEPFYAATISQIGTLKCLERFHACIRISPECTQYGVYGKASYGKIRQFCTLAILPMCSSVLVTVLVLGPSYCPSPRS